MGRRGPAPKPTALKIIEGNPGKQKLNRDEPKPPVSPKIPRPPKRLLPDAKDEWKRLAPVLVRLGVLTEVDWDAFAELCQNYAYYIIADRRIVEKGEAAVMAMQTTPSGYTQQHPYLSLRRQYYEQWHRGLADFGLTPASRARIAVDVNTKNGASDDPLEKLISGDY